MGLGRRALDEALKIRMDGVILFYYLISFNSKVICFKRYDQLMASI